MKEVEKKSWVLPTPIPLSHGLECKRKQAGDHEAWWHSACGGLTVGNPCVSAGVSSRWKEAGIDRLDIEAGSCHVALGHSSEESMEVGAEVIAISPPSMPAIAPTVV